MRQYLMVLTVVLAFVWMSCEDETIFYQEDSTDAVLQIEKVSELQGAVSFDAAGVLKVLQPGPAPSIETTSAGDYPLTLIASISPPSREDGTLFTASHVDVSGNYAFVGYNTAGDIYEGAIDVINISDANNPYATARLIFRNADVNAVVFNGGYVYVVGGIDAESSSSAISNSYLARIPVRGGDLITEDIRYRFQQGFNATGVITRQGRVLVSSGKEGSITAYRRSDLTILAEAYMADARDLEHSQRGLAVLDAGSGVRILDADLRETALIPIGTDLGETSKRTLDSWNQWIVVAEAANGAGIYEAGSGSLVQYLPIPLHPEGVDEGYIVTNAVSVNENAIFMANGGAGLSFAEREGSGARTVGLIDLERSVNYVVSQDDFAFAAAGDDGMHIIKLNRPPDSLDTRYVDIPQYEGLARLRVAKGSDVSYRGSKRLNSVSVQGSLSLAGSWTIYDALTIEREGDFELVGMLALGSNDRRKDMVVGEGAQVQIEGDVTIYGDLILKEGARLRFTGDRSSLDIFGEVHMEGEVTIEGTFRDVRQAF